MSDAMSWGLDHVFFATAEHEVVEAGLAESGLVLSAGRVHQGQGTANTYSTFGNAFLEVLFPHDYQELSSDLVRPLGLSERIHWRETGACPFGICFRENGTRDGLCGRPFPTWAYEPPYVPVGVSIPIVTPAGSLAEPLVFLSFRAPAGTAACRNAFELLTHVEVRRPGNAAQLSKGVSWFVENGLFSMRADSEYLLQLEFDGGREGKTQRISPDVPIVVRW